MAKKGSAEETIREIKRKTGRFAGQRPSARDTTNAPLCSDTIQLSTWPHFLIVLLALPATIGTVGKIPYDTVEGCSLASPGYEIVQAFLL